MTNVAQTTLTEEVRMGSHRVTLGVTKGVKKGVKLKLIASLHLVLSRRTPSANLSHWLTLAFPAITIYPLSSPSIYEQFSHKASGHSRPTMTTFRQPLRPRNLYNHRCMGNCVLPVHQKSIVSFRFRNQLQ